MNDQMIFSHTTVDLHFDKSLTEFIAEHTIGDLVFLVDENVLNLHSALFENTQVINVPSGELYKTQATTDAIIEKLLDLGIDKQATLVGVGGGVTTDVAGYVASIYKRGIPLVLFPTTILSMVDAAVGGKNGVNTLRYKNTVGTIYQPKKIIFDFRFLETLPRQEWINGFAEIIKHGCIKDAPMLNELKNHDVDFYMHNHKSLQELVKRNVAIKSNVVTKDETEKGERMLLNFGHTFGHGVEKVSGMQHGFAISVGMMMAAKLSEEISGFYSEKKEFIQGLLQQYELPVVYNEDKLPVWKSVLGDKKRNKETMPFILLTDLGVAKIENIPLEQLKDLLDQVL